MLLLRITCGYTRICYCLIVHHLRTRCVITDKSFAWRVKSIRYLDVSGVRQEHQQPGSDPHLEGCVPFEFETLFVHLGENSCAKGGKNILINNWSVHDAQARYRTPPSLTVWVLHEVQSVSQQWKSIGSLDLAG